MDKKKKTIKKFNAKKKALMINARVSPREKEMLKVFERFNLNSRQALILLAELLLKVEQLPKLTQDFLEQERLEEENEE